MNQVSLDQGKGMPARTRAEAGFTMVELLVTMVVAVIVLVGATYGLSLAFRQSTEISDRSQNTSNASLGMQRLTLDLREAVPCPSYTDAAGTAYYPQVTVSAGTVTAGWTTPPGSGAVVGLYVTSNTSDANFPILATCDPLPGTHSGTPPQDALIVWNCESSTATCVRTFRSIPSNPSVTNNTYGALTSSTTIAGVKQFQLSGIQASSPTPASLVLGTTYALSTGIFNGTTTYAAISWVGINALFYNLSDPSASASAAANADITKKTSPIPLTTGAALRNYGT